jgi:archaellum component FlaF (FlaF/FlaG flagellin family)
MSQTAALRVMTIAVAVSVAVIFSLAVRSCIRSDNVEKAVLSKHLYCDVPTTCAEPVVSFWADRDNNHVQANCKNNTSYAAVIPDRHSGKGHVFELELLTWAQSHPGAVKLSCFIANVK